jgi:signal transduction histidine kinase
MAHGDARDLNAAAGATGRGYAARVSSALPAWLSNPPPRVVDAGVALLVALPTTTSAVASGAGQHRLAWGIAIGVGIVLPLLMRRTHPFLALAIVLALAVISPVDVPPLPVAVLLWTIGATRSWEATIASGAAVVGVGAIYWAAGGPSFDLGSLVGLALLCAVASIIGLYVGTKRAGVDALRERAERLDRERVLLAERAVAEERVRIAQELHDVVAHNVSLIVVQAQALGATAGDDRVRTATDGIADLGREAMAEMHRTLKLLRASDQAAERGPQPGLEDLGALLERSQAAGLDVALEVEGRPRPLTQSVDLSAFRIVQEALTNVIKHAGRARTSVRLRWGAEALELTIVDLGDPAGPVGAVPGSGAAGGHGLIGMRERTALFGGTLTAGPRDGLRGFEVRASLPYGEAGG